MTISSTAQTRVQYDEIAHLYDAQPYREKKVDPHLLAFLRQQPAGTPSSPAILDLCCGTGNQLVANRSLLPQARLVGLDLSYEMLAQATRKAQDILWVQADSSRPPFLDQRFDFISNQFAFHHVRDKEAMLTAMFRLLRPGGQFVMINLAPHEMPGWIHYRYFPTALTRDLQDFMPHDVIVAMLRQIGFVNVTWTLDHTTTEQDLQQFLDIVCRRDTCSQLLTISDQEYQAGLQQIRNELRQGHRMVPTEDCLLTVCAEKPL